MGGAPLEAMREDLRLRSDEWLKLSIPALLYTVQNIMLYVGYANLEAAVGMVTYQTKVLFTAFCSVLLLGKKLNVNQWSAVAILAVGIVCVQGIFDAKPPKPRVRSHRHHKHTGVRMLSEMDGASLFELVDGRALGESSEGNVALGITAMLIASACTSFASVYFEKMLKSDSKPNLWLRNIQLAGYSSIVALLTLLCQNDPALAANGWFHNFGFNAWLSVLTNALGGLLVAVTIKYADNILRGFAQALAIIMGAIGSHFVFGSTFGASFVVGVGLVIASIFMYGATAATPYELCENTLHSICCR